MNIEFKDKLFYLFCILVSILGTVYMIYACVVYDIGNIEFNGKVKHIGDSNCSYFSDIPLDAKYCNSCGDELVGDKVAVVFNDCCSGCGRFSINKSTYCNYCGDKLTTKIVPFSELNLNSWSQYNLLSDIFGIAMLLTPVTWIFTFIAISYLFYHKFCIKEEKE